MWFVRVGSQVTGPFAEEELRAMRNRGEFSPIHQISVDRRRWESAVDLVKRLDEHRKEPAIGPKTDPGTAGHVPNEPDVRTSSATMNAEWYFLDSTGKHVGPLPQEELWSLFYTKRLAEGTLVCKAGEARWVRAARHPDLVPLLSPNYHPTRTISVFAGLAICMLSTLAMSVVWLRKPKTSQFQTELSSSSRTQFPNPSRLGSLVTRQPATTTS